VILFLFHRIARTFFQSVPVILWHRTVSMPFLAPNAHFLPDAKTPLPWLPLFSCEFFHFLLHPVAAVLKSNAAGSIQFLMFPSRHDFIIQRRKLDVAAQTHTLKTHPAFLIPGNSVNSV